MKRNVLTVFLASPGDLEPERRITCEIVERINKVVSRRVDWHVELLGWEDTLPGYSRPQDIINRDVDCCDLFLGLLWKRWGQPTGKCSSGFHEEFLRARERHVSSGVPEIWLFFKTIDSDNLGDPGEQLRKVLEFKGQQEEKKELKFNKFGNPESWEKLIYDQLLAYILDLGREPKETGPDKALPTSKEKQRDVTISGEEKPEPATSYPPELGSMLQKTSSHLNGEDDAKLDFWDKTRLFLLASSWFSSAHLDEPLGVHEVNLVYSRRKSWELSAEELMLIFRTMVIDEYDTRPGWYWFQGEEENVINDGLCSIAVAAKDKESKKIALTLMTKTGFHPPKEIIETVLSDSENEVVLKAIELLAYTGLPQDTRLLDKALESKESAIKSAAVAARLDMLYREDPNNAFHEYAQVGGNTPIFVNAVSEKVNLSVGEVVLLESLKSPHTQVRRFIANCLRSQAKLDAKTARSLLGDADSEVRRLALWALVEAGEKITAGQVRELFPPKRTTLLGSFGLFGSSIRHDYESHSIQNEFCVAILKQRSPEEILASLETYDSDNDVAYHYLAVNHFELIESRIRSDLDNEFAGLISELEHKGWERSTVDFVKAKMIRAALAGLAAHGNESDVRYARKFLGKTCFNTADPEAAKLLLKYGDISDVEKLIEVALASGGETRQPALEGALKLTNDKIPVLEIMLKEGDAKTAGKAANELWVLDEARVREISKAMLNADDTDKRLRGLAIWVKFCKKVELEALLDEYIATSPHYYNVVTWLDKTLYAPGRYGEFFRNELLGHL